jgi:hypothetical protein
VVNQPALQLFLVLLGFALFTVMNVWMSWRERQQEDSETAARVVNDSIPDVLYLRTFDSDVTALNFMILNFILACYSLILNSVISGFGGGFRGVSMPLTVTDEVGQCEI